MTTARGVKPFRVRYERDGDTGHGSRIVGYTSLCSCGQQTPRLSSVAAVRAWKQVHAAQGHPEA